MRLAPRALLFAVTIAVAVGGVVALGSLRRPVVHEVVRAWTWVGAPGDAAATAAVVADEAWRGDVVVRLLGRAPSAADAAQVATWTRASATADGIRFVVVGADEDEAVRRERAVAEAFASWDRARAQAERVAALAAEEARVEAVTERIRAAQVLGPAAADEIETLLAERDAAIARRDAAAAALAAAAPSRLEPQQAVVRTQERHAVRDALVAAIVAFAAALLAGLRRVAPASSRDLGRERAGGRVAARASAAPRASGSGASPAARKAPRQTPAAAKPARGAAGDPATLVVFPSTASDGADALARAGARLAAAVRAPLASARPGVLVVTSIADGEGKTTVAAHLAEALAQGGTRTLLVDGSLWSPALAERYQVAPASGDDGKRIASTLDWMQKPMGSHHVVAVELGGGRRLDLVPQFRATRPAPGTAEALFGAFGDAIGRWGGYDVIVVDAAALGTVADTRLLLPFATGVLVVIDAAQDQRRRRLAVRKLLREADAPLLGFVVATPPHEAAGPDATGRDGG